MSWTAIFKAGKRTDSQGRTRTWSTEDLDKVVDTYDPAKREAPLVLGHPKDNGPAFGWVEKLRRVGDVLEAKFRQVPEELKQAVAAGRYKYKSVSLYADGSLRHVGILGAAQPAVEGLGEVKFSGDEEHFEYLQEDDVTIEELKKKLEKEEAARKAAEAKLGESETEKQKLLAQFAEAEEAKAKEAREARFDKLVEEGKAMPAEKGKVLKFAEALNGVEEEVCFSESEGKKRLLDHFWQFLEDRKPHGLFEEFKAPEGKADEPFEPMTKYV